MPVALFSTAVLSTALGSWVLLDRPSQSLNKIFFLLCASVAGWATVIGFSQLSFQDGLPRGPQSIALGYLFGCAIPYLFYATCRTLHGPPKTRQSFHAAAIAGLVFCIYLGFSGAIVQRLVIVDGSSYYKLITGPGFPFFLSYVIALGLLSITEIVLKYRSSDNQEHKVQLAYFGLGTGLSFLIAVVCNVVLPTFNISSLSPYGASSPLLALGILSLSITRHQLMHVRVRFQWTTSVCLWILALWVPLTIYLILSRGPVYESSGYRFALLFFLALWLVILYLVSRFSESRGIIGRPANTKPQSNSRGAPGNELSNDIDALQGLIEALIHDLSSTLTLTVVKEKRGKTSAEIISDYKNVIAQLRSVNSLLSLGNLTLARAECDLNGMVAELLDSRATIIRAKQIEVSVDKLPIVEIDRLSTKYILSNIFDNALKYVGDKETSEVSIGCAILNSHLRIMVKDNGVGIKSREVGRVTTALFRGSNQIVRGQNVQGHGIGLTITDRLLSRLGGTMQIDSKEGIGTTVTIDLPML